ncbi:F-box/FBD/LRR-repeat protein At4g26340-like isoform X1 [Punica granatum]|uniref:F-box/FBD/LRR-repeat protein At4g26340-like isoform X1 n=1 Tax=Punica granatum TaxID=22663 RepID=A0A6P8EIB1_PUNGR|nr:F-box/FBD/LRR-repeat protein At4g26340-like isoform X1 [Punica granatum]
MEWERSFRRKARKGEAGLAAEMDVDKFSTLPEHVQHHILSFIPSIEEVANTSLVSKSWLGTWRSFLITDFKPWLILPDADVSDFMETGLGEYGKSFVKFVDGALMRSREGMPRFGFFVNAELAPHLDRWLGMALDCHVKELSINIMSDLPYSIPARVLSAHFIKTLTLTGGVEIDGISAVSLPSLRLLHLVCTLIDNQMFQRLLGGCPLLEDLSLCSCGLLSEIKVPNLHYLERVTVAGMGPEIKVVSIEAPGLESFKLDRGYQYVRVRDIGLAVHVSPNVRGTRIQYSQSNSRRLVEFSSSTRDCNIDTNKVVYNITTITYMQNFTVNKLC